VQGEWLTVWTECWRGTREELDKREREWERGVMEKVSACVLGHMLVFVSSSTATAIRRGGHLTPHERVHEREKSGE
jgi:hypothetical protein